MDYPLLIGLLSFVTLLFSARVGAHIRRRHPLETSEREDFSTVVGGTLTLLSLIIGFSFSMVITRYDQRKSYEEAEANAIGTEYLRARLLPADDGQRVRQLLRQYLDQRILFYAGAEPGSLSQINDRTAQLQTDLWSTVCTVSERNPTPIVALVTSGMNDVLNSQGYTQSAWWNRLPPMAWCFVGEIAVFSNLLVGYGAHRTSTRVFCVLPLAVSLSLALIADIDSPRGGFIRVMPQNLISVAQSVRAQ